MKSTDLRIGNLATVCYEDRKPDTLIVLDPGMVHFASQKRSDNEVDVIGVYLTVEKLIEIDFFKKCKGRSFTVVATKSGKVEVVVSMGKHQRRCKYLHELQNAYWWLTEK